MKHIDTKYYTYTVKVRIRHGMINDTQLNWKTEAMIIHSIECRIVLTIIITLNIRSLNIHNVTKLSILLIQTNENVNDIVDFD